MIGTAILCTILLAAGIAVLRAVLRDEKAKRAEWRPEGYRRGPEHSRAVVSDWWHRKLPPVALWQSVRVLGTPPAAELVSVNDPRIIRTNRHLSAPAIGAGSAPKRRSRRERVRRIEKARAMATLERAVVELGIRQEVP